MSRSRRRHRRAATAAVPQDAIPAVAGGSAVLVLERPRPAAVPDPEPVDEPEPVAESVAETVAETLAEAETETEAADTCVVTVVHEPAPVPDVPEGRIAPTRLAEPPAGSRIALREEAGQGEIVLPCGGFRGRTLLWAVLGAALCMLGLGAVVAAAMGNLPSLAATLAAVLSIGSGTLFLAWCLVRARAHEVVREQRDGLCYRQQLGRYTWQHRFVLKRTVTEVAGVNNGPYTVAVRADDETLLMGIALPTDECRWLQDALRVLVCR